MTGFWLEPSPLVLASKSAIRAKILADAGVPADIRPADIDERGVEARLEGADAAAVAVALAIEKALAGSRASPGRLTLGCDQTLSLKGERFSKPRSREEGRAQLERLSGATHVLASGAALARDGTALWSGVSEVRLTMRAVSNAFIDTYLDAAGDAAFASVGGYQFEGVGAQLFERADGDFFTILGLPLLATLDALRDIGALMR